MVAPDTESVEYQLHIKAEQVFKELQRLTAQATTFSQKVEMVSASLKNFSKETGLHLKNVASAFKEMDKNFSDATGKSAFFGEAQKLGWDEVEKGAGRAVRSIDAVRIALGVLVSMLIFQVWQAITTFFSQAIDQAKQFETTLYRLSNAERQLSLAGVEVSLKGLKKGILDIQSALPIFSKEDVSELVGSLAVSTKELGFNEKQILKLGAAIAILNVNSSETESLLQTQAKVTNSLISPQAKSIGALGLSFGKAKIEAKAFEMGLLSVGETFADLTEHEKTQVKYQIVLETAGIGGIDDISKLRDEIQKAGGDFEALNEFLNSNTGRLAENASAWKDLQTAVGQFLIPFLPTVTSLLDHITGGINAGKAMFSVFAAIVGAILNTMEQLRTGGIRLKETVEYFKFALKDLAAQWLKAFFPDVPANAPQWFKDLYERNVGKPVGAGRETPTAAGVSSGEELEVGQEHAKMVKEREDKLQDILKDSADKKLDIEREYQQKLQDLARNNSQRLEDIARHAAEKAADARRDYADKVEDINRDADQKKEEVQADANKRAIQAEKDYQDELKKLREKYLLDLEEALHDRDARQILHLMRQYEADKNNIKDKRAKEKQESQEKLKQQLQDIERDRKLKLEAAAQDLQDKLKDIKRAAGRERQEAQINYNRQLADARIAHQRALEEQRIYLQRKLRDLAEALAKEYNLTQSGLQALSSLYSAALSSIGSPIGSASSPASINAGTYVAPTNTGFSGSGMYGTTGLAEGGSFLATTPRTLNVAEHGPELVSAIPLGRAGADVNKLFTNRSSSKSGMGQMEIAVTLSPDLEARVIRQSLNEAANVLFKVNRSKV